MLGYEPIHNAQGHVVSIATYLACHREEITDTLRAAAAGEFDAGTIPDRYASMVTELGKAQLRRTTPPTEWSGPLDPDPDWLDAFDLPPEPLIVARVAEWLGSDPRRQDATDASLPLLEKTRSANLRAISVLAERANLLLPVWPAKHLAAVPPSLDADDLKGEFSRRGLLTSDPWTTPRSSAGWRAWVAGRLTFRRLSISTHST